MATKKQTPKDGTGTRKAKVAATPPPAPPAAAPPVAAYAAEALIRSPELLEQARSYKDELRKRMGKVPSFVAAFAAGAAPTP
ncbi:MAG TPA: hypothetical protein VGE98_12640, partial [Thermoanaerobaculia bacterium]